MINDEADEDLETQRKLVMEEDEIVTMPSSPAKKSKKKGKKGKKGKKKPKRGQTTNILISDT